MLEKLLDHLLFSYVFAFALFLLCRFFNKAACNHTEGFLNAANIGLLLLLSLNMIVTVLNLVQCMNSLQVLSDNASGDGAVFGTKRSCIAVLLLNFVFSFLFHLIFLWRKLRVKIWLTVMLSLMLLFLLNYEYGLVYWVENWGSGSSWAIYYSGPTEWVVAAFTVIYFIVCWIISGRKPQHRLSK